MSSIKENVGVFNVEDEELQQHGLHRETKGGLLGECVKMVEESLAHRVDRVELMFQEILSKLSRKPENLSVPAEKS
jgi:hypothetical protein